VQKFNKRIKRRKDRTAYEGDEERTPSISPIPPVFHYHLINFVAHLSKGTLLSVLARKAPVEFVAHEREEVGEDAERGGGEGDGERVHRADDAEIPYSVRERERGGEEGMLIVDREAVKGRRRVGRRGKREGEG
jgi:hypothetical protein